VSVVNWMNNHSLRPWKFHDLFIHASRYSSHLGSISYCHILHETNHMADTLAKQGVDRVHGFLAWI